MEEKIIYTITVRTTNDGVRAAAVVKNTRSGDGEIKSQLMTAFAQEDLDVLMSILDGSKPISTALGGEIHGD